MYIWTIQSYLGTWWFNYKINDVAWFMWAYSHFRRLYKMYIWTNFIYILSNLFWCKGYYKLTTETKTFINFSFYLYQFCLFFYVFYLRVTKFSSNLRNLKFSFHQMFFCLYIWFLVTELVVVAMRLSLNPRFAIPDYYWDRTYICIFGLVKCTFSVLPLGLYIYI